MLLTEGSGHFLLTTYSVKSRLTDANRQWARQGHYVLCGAMGGGGIWHAALEATKTVVAGAYET